MPINRQQFNKFLAGQAEPSLHNLRKVVDFFGVEEAEIYLPPADAAFAGAVEAVAQGEHVSPVRAFDGRRIIERWWVA